MPSNAAIWTVFYTLGMTSETVRQQFPVAMQRSHLITKMWLEMNQEQKDEWANVHPTLVQTAHESRMAKGLENAEGVQL